MLRRRVGESEKADEVRVGRTGRSPVEQPGVSGLDEPFAEKNTFKSAASDGEAASVQTRAAFTLWTGANGPQPDGLLRARRGPALSGGAQTTA